MLPELEKAAAALDFFKADDITTLKAYNNPPKALDYVM